jgi:spore maturation protein CgeB
MDDDDDDVIQRSFGVYGQTEYILRGELEEGQNSLIVATPSVKALADATHRLLADEHLRARITANALRMVAESFTVSASAARYVNAIRTAHEQHTSIRR